MYLDKNSYYYITSGKLIGCSMKPNKVSSCGHYGFFIDPLNGDEVRIHSKHLETEEPDLSVGVLKLEDKKATVALEVAAHSYITSENLKRTEVLRAELMKRTTDNMLLVEAIREGSDMGMSEKTYLIICCILSVIVGLFVGLIM